MKCSLNYQSNSFKSKEDEKKPERLKGVVKGGAKLKKKTEIEKIKSDIIVSDISTIISSVMGDIIVPSIKKTISDVVTNGIDMLLFGEDGRDRQKTNASRISYGSFFDGRSSQSERSKRLSRNGLDYDNIIFDRRSDAEMVLTVLEENIDRFGIVSVGDLYDLAEIETNNYMANRYGWTDLAGANVVRVRDGWMLKLPKAYLLD